METILLFFKTFDCFIILFTIVFSVGHSSFVFNRSSFIHFLLIFECIVVSSCLLIEQTANVNNSVEGAILCLYIIAIVAAETAIAIGLYITITMLPPNRIISSKKRVYFITEKFTISEYFKKISKE